jgi:hypothetical protein
LIFVFSTLARREFKANLLGAVGTLGPVQRTRSEPFLDCGTIQVRDDTDALDRDHFSLGAAQGTPGACRVPAAHDHQGVSFDGNLCRLCHEFRTRALKTNAACTKGGREVLAKLLSFSDYFSGSTEPIENTAYSARRTIGIGSPS